MESNYEMEFLLQMELTRVMKSVVDRLLIEMDNIFTRLNQLDVKFHFLFDVKRWIGNKSNKSMGSCYLEELCALARFHCSDFDGTETNCTAKFVTSECWFKHVK